MRENSKHFILAYLSLLLKISILKKIGLKGKGATYRELIDIGAEISGLLDKVVSFLSLLY